MLVILWGSCWTKSVTFSPISSTPKVPGPQKKKKSTLFCTNLGSRSENGNAASNNLGSWKSSSKGFCGENEPEVWSWIKPSWLSAEVCDLLDPSVVLLCYVFVKVGDLQLAYTMVFVCDRPLSAARVNETNKSKKANGGFMYSCKERFSVLARNRSHRLLSGCGSDANTFCWSDRHWSEQPFHFFKTRILPFCLFHRLWVMDTPSNLPNKILLGG